MTPGHLLARDATSYSVLDLSAKWRRAPQTIYNWLSRMRKHGRKPLPGQVTIKRLNACRRQLEIREDYAALIRAIFIDRTVRL